MSLPESSEAGGLARRDGEPVFDEPWQAQVMALAFTLMERGAYSNARWSDALAGKLAAATARGEPDDAQTYYRCALAALEELLAGGGQVPPEDLRGRTEAWRRAYLRTPHGQPVVLSAADAAP